MSLLDSSRGYITCERGCAHWGPHGAAGLLLRHDGRYLLQQRAPWVDHGRTWSIPGGALRRGEHPRRAARREAREELGHLPPYQHHTIHRDDHGGWTYHTVVVDTLQPYTPGNGDGEGTRCDWFTPEQIGTLRLHPGFADTWPRILHKLTEQPA